MLKKSFGTLIPLFFLILSCGNPSSPTPSGGRVYKAGDPEPTAPIATDKAFLGWYKSGNFNNIKDRVDFTKKTGGSFQIYPKWTDTKKENTDTKKYVEKYSIDGKGVLSGVPPQGTVLSSNPNEIIVEIPYNVNKISVIEIARDEENFGVFSKGLNSNEEIKVTQVYLPSKDLVKIGTQSFIGIPKLTSIVIPLSVTDIESYAFMGAGLASVTLSEGLTTIGSAAFSRNKALTSITIPSTVTNIGDSVFASSEKLSSVRVEAIRPPAISKGKDSSMFHNTDTGLSIQVPQNSLSAYKVAEGWSIYVGKITAYTE